MRMFELLLKRQVSLFRIILFVATFIICVFQSSASSFNNNSKADSGIYDVHYYDLQLWIDIDKQSIYGSNTIYFKTLQNIDSLAIDLFSQYEIAAITHNRKRVNFKRTGNKTRIHFANTLPKNTSGSIQVHYAGKPPVAIKPPWQGGFVWTKDSMGRPWAAVACEQIGASSWWPCKDDLADEPDSMRMTFNVAKGMFAVSNGQLRKISAPADDKYNTFEWFVSYPINPYNVTVNVGFYERIRDSYLSDVKDSAGRNINYLVDYFFLDYNVQKAKAFFADATYARTKTMLKAFEKYFGVYPFSRDGYALVEAPYWGMEHQSAVAYGNGFALNSYGFDFILVHESGHEWWGNAVSCNDAGDMWIHESFTTHSEALFVEYLYGYERSVEYLKMQKPNVANKQPVQGPRGINFHARTDNDIYYKGSWMLHTLRSVLDNDSLWFSVLKGLQNEYKYQTVSSEQVIGYIQKNSGKNLEAFFKQYLYVAQLPVLEYSVKSTKGGVIIKYRWKTDVSNFDMPFDIYAKGKKHRIYPKTDFQTIKLKGVKSKDVIINADRFLIELKKL